MPSTKEFIRERKRAYQQCFGSPAGKAVLEDLIKFCRGSESCWHPDPRIHAALEGRREVFLRIEQHVNETSDQLAERYGALDNERKETEQ